MPVADVRKWYVLRTFSGHEKKIREALERELKLNGAEDKIAETVIPTETVFEMRNGKKRTREKTLYPGYLFIHSTLDAELKHIISGLNGVMGFLSTGANGEPAPLRPDEAKRMLGRMEESELMGEQPEVPYNVGDAVKVIDGPFNNFSGNIEEVYPDKMKVRVMVSIFGRKTPLELDYVSVERED
tara:strand:+ start:31 stop:585 length:555 start_codon:yes stop_codon:yes gene_type:complete